MPPLGSEPNPVSIGIENPAGTLDATTVACGDSHGIEIRSVAYRRSAQILMRGHLPLYGASKKLQAALHRSQGTGG